MTVTKCDCCEQPCSRGAFRHRLDGVFRGWASVSFEHEHGFGEMCDQCWATFVSVLSDSLSEKKNLQLMYPKDDDPLAPFMKTP